MSVAHPILPLERSAPAALGALLSRGKNHIDMTEAIYRQQAELLCRVGDSVALRHTVSGEILISAGDRQGMERLLEKVPREGARVVLHQPWSQEYFPNRQAEERILWYWPDFAPPEGNPDYEVWPLDLGDVEDALRCDPTLPRRELEGQIQRRRVYGACIRDTLAGTVGTAPGGELTYLSIRPDLRGQGMGTTLLRWMLRRELRQGHVPYLLLPPKAGAGEKLARRAGLVPGEEPLIRIPFLTSEFLKKIDKEKSKTDP